MNNENKRDVSVGGGVGFLDLLSIAFIVLKLCGVISWPWLWVLSPLWLPVAIVFTITLIVLWIETIISLINHSKSK